MAKKSDKMSLEELDSRLEKAKAGHSAKQPKPRTGGNSALGIAYRLAMEIVIAVIVGGAIGWGLDTWLNTGPIFLVIFLFIGMAAGFMTAYRASEQMRKSSPSSGDTPGNGKDKD